MTTIGVAASVLSLAACIRTTDRVVEPVGAGDASAPAPDLDDAGLNPLTPLARPPESVEDYRVVRAPEFGLADGREERFKPSERPAGPVLNGGAGGSAGTAGSERRPVASGGVYF